MKLFFKTAIIASILFIHHTDFLHSQTIKIVAEVWEPYIYQENGDTKGICTEIVKAAIQNSGLTIDDNEIKLYPWVRAYNLAIKEDNVLIFPILRTSEREKEFKWIGPIIKPDRFYFYKNKDRQDVVVKTLEDARMYSIGFLRGSMHEDFLAENKFDCDSLFGVANQKYNLLKLLNNRIDLTINSRLGLEILTREMKLSPDQFEETIFVFEYEYYMAFSKNTSDEIVERLQVAFSELNSTGKINEIINKYEKYLTNPAQESPLQ